MRWRPFGGCIAPSRKTESPAVGANGSDVYAQAIAVALRYELGATHQAMKVAMRWTGASERTVKYWLAGSVGPSGEHSIALARHSDTVLMVLLRKAGRLDYRDAIHLIEAQEMLKEVSLTIRKIVGDGH